MATFVPLAGFVPDADPTTPGVLTACDGWVPSTKGMRAAYSAYDTGKDALAAACCGLYTSRYADGTNKLYAGTASDLYELSGTSWTSRKGSITVSATSYWRWATLGNDTYASNVYNKVAKASTTNFATITEAPKAALLTTALGFLIAANYDDGTVTPDGVYWSAQYDTSDWTPDVATRCGALRLTSTPGPITALRTLNDQVVAYKERSIYIGSDTGGEQLWLYRLASADVGAVSQEAVVDVEYAHFFLGYDNFYAFDGNVPVAIGAGIKEWFFRQVDRTNIGKVQGLYDRDRGVIYWFYPTAGGSALTKWVAYHLGNKRWGAGSMAVEWVAETLTVGGTWDTLYTGTWDALMSVSSWDASSFDSSLPFPTVINTSHKLCYLSGLPGTATFTTGRIGDEEQVALLRRISPRWTTRPGNATLVNLYAMVAGDTMSSDPPRTMTSSGWFDLLRASRWHAAQLTTTGTAELVGISVDAVPQGRL